MQPEDTLKNQGGCLDPGGDAGLIHDPNQPSRSLFPSNFTSCRFVLWRLPLTNCPAVSHRLDSSVPYAYMTWRPVDHCRRDVPSFGDAFHIIPMFIFAKDVATHKVSQADGEALAAIIAVLVEGGLEILRNLQGGATRQLHTKVLAIHAHVT